MAPSILIAVPLAATASSPWPYIALMLAGFAVGIAGHVIRSKATVATGIGMIFIATVLLPIFTQGFGS